MLRIELNGGGGREVRICATVDAALEVATIDKVNVGHPQPFKKSSVCRF